MSTADTARHGIPPGTIYYVVALRATGPENIVPCVYFDDHYRHVRPDDLVTAKDSDAICFVDCGSEVPGQILEQLSERWLPAPDSGVSLFSAVAKTLDQDTGRDNMFKAEPLKDGKRVIVVPVKVGTRRGVVLVFRRVNEEGRTSRLIATTDPEIRNGSG